MQIDNYLNLTRYPAQISLVLDRSESFREVMHAHGGLEIIYVHEGCGHVVLNQKKHAIRPGTLIYYKPFQPHHVHMDIDANQPYIRSMFLFEPTLLWDYFKPFDSLMKFMEILWKSTRTPQVVQVQSPVEVNDFFTSLATRFGHLSTTSYRTEENALILLTILHYLRNSFERNERSKTWAGKRPDQMPPVIKQILDWMEDHYSEKFELQALADFVHLSPNHLSYVFRKETGNSLSEYMASRRLKQASMMLKTSDQPIRDIGMQVGFDNFSYFCKVFKDKFGMTPSAYRSTLIPGSSMTSELS